MSDTPKADGLNRRDFLKVMGVAGGAAALTGACSSDPVDRVIPYVITPEDTVPGIPKFYSSTCTGCPAGCGIVVKNREGRAIKVEGNPKSPVNSGRLCAMGQALPQELYNPDRLREPLLRGSTGKLEPVGWEKALELLTDYVGQAAGGKVVFLTGSVTGTMERLIREWTGAIGGEHISYEPLSYEPLAKANELTFGLKRVPTYHIERADFLLSFGADFLETWLSPTDYQHQYSEMHSFDGHTMGKHVQVEPRMSLTGASADKWLAIKPGTEGHLALGIVHAIVKGGRAKIGGSELSRVRRIVAPYTPEKVERITEITAEAIDSLAKEFSGAHSSLALGGGAASATTEATSTLAAVNLLNYVAGNVGKTIDFGQYQTSADTHGFARVASLVEDMKAGKVQMLLVWGSNPAYSLPGALGFAEAAGNVPFIIDFSSMPDETTELSTLVLPDHTVLESWGDAVPRNGVYSLVQPAVVPVFNTRPTGDVLLQVSRSAGRFGGGIPAPTYYDYLKDSWKSIHRKTAPRKPFEEFWRQAAIDGGVFTSVSSPSVSLAPGADTLKLGEAALAGTGDMYFVAYPSYRLLDGRGANKPWLQELPDALTTAVWDSWVEINPETASRLGVSEGDFVQIKSPVGTIETQVFVYEGIRPDTVAVGLGQGHTSYGRYAKGRGVNPADILPVAVDEASGGFAWLSTKVQVMKTSKSAPLVKTQRSMDQFDRHIAQQTTVAAMIGMGKGEGGHEGAAANGGHHAEPDFYPKHKYLGHKWGMSVDLSKCVGCGACVVACNAENNIPFVGKLQMAKRREMSWIRIERYFEHTADGALDVRFLPMPCQHCENAPCEPVCPVFATYHNPEGLNAMVYSRCVGTRYCSNNCSYKVRRFNWFDFTRPEPLDWQLNPDVTVRSVGIMEKCSFCIQRIHAAKDTAKDEGRVIADGEVRTACQQTCPSDAIVFGDTNDPETAVSRSSGGPRGYHVLEELNTQPAITYLKKVKWERV